MAETNGDRVRRYYESFQAGDPAGVLDQWDAMTAPDAVLHEAASLPFAGSYRGRDGIIQLLGQIAQFVPDARGLKVDHIIDDGDNVVVILRAPMTPPGRDEPVEMLVAEWYQFRDGKLVEVRPFYWDTAVAAGLFVEPNA